MVAGEPDTNHEWAVVPETGKVYVYPMDKALCYDSAARTWEDLGAKPRASCRIWGSMCYDPVNYEILHAGGDGADVVTWVYGIEKNEWRRLEFGSAKIRGLRPVEFKDSRFSWSDALRCDPALKLVLLNNSSARKVWVLKFGRKTARMEEMKDE